MGNGYINIASFVHEIKKQEGGGSLALLSDQSKGIIDCKTIVANNVNAYVATDGNSIYCSADEGKNWSTYTLRGIQFYNEIQLLATTTGASAIYDAPCCWIQVHDINDDCYKLYVLKFLSGVFQDDDLCTVEDPDNIDFIVQGDSFAFNLDGMIGVYTPKKGDFAWDYSTNDYNMVRKCFNDDATMMYIWADNILYSLDAFEDTSDIFNVAIKLYDDKGQVLQYGNDHLEKIYCLNSNLIIYQTTNYQFTYVISQKTFTQLVDDYCGIVKLKDYSLLSDAIVCLHAPASTVITNYLVMHSGVFGNNAKKYDFDTVLINDFIYNGNNKKIYVGTDTGLMDQDKNVIAANVNVTCLTKDFVFAQDGVYKWPDTINFYQKKWKLNENITIGARTYFVNFVSNNQTFSTIRIGV